MKDEDVYLGAYWMDRRLTAKQFIMLCHAFWLRLCDFSPAFEVLCVAVGKMPNIVPVTVPKDYEGFERVLVKAVPHPEHAYSNPDPSNKDFTLDSVFPVGFRISFADPGLGNVPPTSLSVSVAAGKFGAYSAPNSVLIEIPIEYRTFWEDSQRAQELMKIVVLAAQPTFATLTSTELRKALDPQRANSFPIGIITYFENAIARKAANDTAALEPATGGGVFLKIDAPYPFAASVNLFKPCYSRLSDAGLLQWSHQGQPTASQKR